MITVLANIAFHVNLFEVIFWYF